MRIQRSCLVWVPALVLASSSLLFAVERDSSIAKPDAAQSASNPGTPGRQREGSTLVDVIGTFKLTSDRATFYPAGSALPRYQGLENLNLERISLVVGENPDRLDWIVSGTITEFRGTNYLLVTKAILKNKAHSPAR